nr:hypothetical protein [uncultured Methanoregula sp.]
MTGTVRLSPVEREACTILENEGYRVMPMRSCFASRYKPVNLMARREPGELVYLKLRQIARLPDNPGTREEFCREEARLLRTFFPLETEGVKLRKEIWVQFPEGGFWCFEIQANGIKALARRDPVTPPGRKKTGKRNRLA